eukprot:CAMPEP_0198286026 /NCGR_PEP_ID=MMETSP1449-20131203/5206_1 /TAXON_ID=420275 /ORGANISM="Attheya septentrionalis, Strain CCMP2084" /LENGTH=776 /DNA_ID=CAMNT_0043983645 /DNA_START=235 /DNA_END=2565 /DNA_ORIENTATION=+
MQTHELFRAKSNLRRSRVLGVILLLSVAILRDTTLCHEQGAFGVVSAFSIMPVRRMTVSSVHHHPRNGLGGTCSRTSFQLKSTTDPKVESTPLSLETNFPQASYDPEDWNAYEEAIQELIKSRRFLSLKGKNKSTEDIQIVSDWLLQNRRPLIPIHLPLLTTPTPVMNNVQGKENDDSIFTQLQEQRNRYIEKTKLTKSQYEMISRAISYLGDNCAKQIGRLQNSPQQDGAPVITPTEVVRPLTVGWEKMLEAGMAFRGNSLSTYLYALSSDLDSESNNILAGQVATFHDLLCEPNEKTVSVRIKSLVARGDALGAEQVLTMLDSNDSNKNGLGDVKKLRTYQPLLKLYCSLGADTTQSVLRLYKRMKAESTVLFDAETYIMVLAAIAKHGYFFQGAPPIEGAVGLGYPVASGPELFDVIVQEMADDILEINSDCAQQLTNSLFEGQNQQKKSDLEDPNGQLAKEGELVASRVAINSKTALCPRTGIRLRLIILEKLQRKQVHDGLLKMAAAQYEEFVIKLKTKHKQMKNDVLDPEYGARELSLFSQWLDEREGEPFTAIVDGANVGYFGHFSVHYSQIEGMVRKLEAMGENPLVVMPVKYVAPSFMVSSRFQQKQKPEELESMQRLLDEGKIYQVPAKCLDDYYWMLASVSDQTTSRNGADIDVSPNNKDGRFPGLRPMVITNDQMRDHHLDLIERRLFRRWCSCHIVNYDFASYEEDEWLERNIMFTSMDFFSNEIQSNPSSSESTDDNSGKVWHFPVSDWEDVNERFCIRIPR